MADDMVVEEEKADEQVEAAAEVKEETEKDAATDSRPKVAAGTVEISSSDSTVNVFKSNGGQILTSLMAGGWQYMLAGARANVGLTSGRYLFEVRLLELHFRADVTQGQRVPMPRQLVRVGLSTEDSSLLLGDGSESQVSIDSEGYVSCGKVRKKIAQPWRQSVVGVLVNLEKESTNANTISLFRDGVRICEPYPIPEPLLGKPLFPTLSFKCVTLQVNFGPVPMSPLPFTCNMLGSVAEADAKVKKTSQEGPGHLVVPVGLPEQGYFDWVDDFLEKNPSYFELSERKIADWALKSGLWRTNRTSGSMDRPDVKFSVPVLEDSTVKRLMLSIAPTIQGNFIVPELKANLLASERSALLRLFSGPGYKKVAKVIMGEPNAAFKQRVQDLLIEDKKKTQLVEQKKKAAEEARRRVMEERKRAALRLRGEDEAAPEEKEKEKEAEQEDKATPMETETIVELTEEEKKMWYRPSQTPDVADQATAKCYADFSLPASSEGFDEVTFEWSDKDKAESVLKEWKFAKKLTQKVEDIKPGEAFKEAWAEWSSKIEAWKKQQIEWKSPAKRKEKAEAKQKEAEEKGDEEGAVELAAAAAKEEVDPDTIEALTVEDISDIGGGQPLFAKFASEDWALLSMRYEIFLLVHSFKKDVNDPDRLGFTEKDLSFYYNKYFKKTFSLKYFELASFDKLVKLLQDALKVEPESKFIATTLPEDTPLSKFVKLAEEHRRIRHRRAEAGDENAELHFGRPNGHSAHQPPVRPVPGGRLAYPSRAYVPGSVNRSLQPTVQQKRPVPTISPTLEKTAFIAKRPTYGSFWKR